MRFVRKSAPAHHQLNTQNAQPPATSTEATSRWQRFGAKSAVIAHALRDQFQLCCYSELRADEAGLGYHIEHVENKGQNPARTFDWNNLAASSLHSDDLAGLNAGDAFGGHAPGKQTAVDMQRFVSCFDPNCPRFFAWTSLGLVVPRLGLTPSEADRARYTIDLLNLNSPYLVNLRARWWDELDQLFQEHQAKGWSLQDLAELDLLPFNDKLSRFFSLTRQFYGRLAEAILAPYPHLQ